LYRFARGFGKFFAICCPLATAIKALFCHGHRTLTAQIHSEFGSIGASEDGRERFAGTMSGAQRESRTWRDRGAGRQLAAQFQLASALAVLAFAALVSPHVRAESRGLVGIRTASAPPSTLAIASAVSLENGSDQAKLTFDLSQRVTATSFVLAEPDRIVIDLPDVDFHIPPQVGNTDSDRTGRMRSPGLIASFRFGHFAPGKSRIVIDLGAPARVLRAEADPIPDEPKSRLVIELARTDSAAFQVAAHNALLAAQAAASDADTAAPAADSAERNGSLPLIVIDPGHGGVDSGAIVNGLVEKDIVFDFAKTLAGKLAASGHYKVVMTRNSDVFLSLGERVHIAQDSGAALFVSIHADTIYGAASVSGATVYTVSDHATDAEAARTAEKENQADAVAGVTANDEANGVSDILADLTRQETRTYSHVFARTLVNYWKVAGRLNKNPERAAGFRVLKAPDVPSVLIELGYLSNAKDAVSLVSPQWRDATSTRLAAAIDAFFAVKKGNFGTSKPSEPATAAAALESPAATEDK
jgi:N-acetylmuramoyl-L-alanine amidase